MEFKITVLGSNSALPAFGRHPSAQFVQLAQHCILLDCGEGTQMRMNDFSIKRGKLDNIFITHLHGDHYFGLFGLLNSYRLLSRTRPLNVYSPAGLEELIMPTIDRSTMPLEFELNFHVIKAEEEIKLYENEMLTVSTFPLEHGIECYGFKISEKPRPRRINVDRVSEMNIPKEKLGEIANGADYTDEFGATFKNANITFDSAPPRIYAYCTDTIYTESIIPYVQDVDLLYHEASFLQNEGDRATLRGHSTTQGAAMIALRASVGRLLIGHFASRHGNLDLFLDEARAIFPNSDVATEGGVFQIKFKD